MLSVDLNQRKLGTAGVRLAAHTLAESAHIAVHLQGYQGRFFMNNHFTLIDLDILPQIENYSHLICYFLLN